MIVRYEDQYKEDVINLGKILDNKYCISTNDYVQYLLYKQENKIIAFVTYIILYETCEIIDIVVSKDAQNNNVGTSLITKVIDFATKNNCVNIFLEVNENNKEAIKFYGKNNFKAISIRKNYYKNNNALIMKRVLDVIK